MDELLHCTLTRIKRPQVCVCLMFAGRITSAGAPTCVERSIMCTERLAESRNRSLSLSLCITTAWAVGQHNSRGTVVSPINSHQPPISCCHPYFRRRVHCSTFREQVAKLHATSLQHSMDYVRLLLAAHPWHLTNRLFLAPSTPSIRVCGARWYALACIVAPHQQHVGLLSGV